MRWRIPRLVISFGAYGQKIKPLRRHANRNRICSGVNSGKITSTYLKEIYFYIINIEVC